MSTPVGNPGGGTAAGHAVRQAFQYLLLLILLVVTAIGVAGLLEAVLARGSTLAVSDSAIAQSIAFTVVGAPLLGLVAWWTRRCLRSDPREVRSTGWVLYLSAAGGIALITATLTLHTLLSWLFGLREVDHTATAQALAWTGIWVVHWRLIRRHPDANAMQPYLLAGSLFGLVVGLLGFGTLLSGAIEIWLGLDAAPLVDTTANAALTGAIAAALGAAVWMRHWLFSAVRATRDQLWWCYVLLAGAGAGLVLSVSTGSVAAWRLAVWWLGEPWTEVADRYFASMPALLAAAIAGLVSLGYHQGVVGTAGSARSEVVRVRDYLLAVIGLGAASVGTTIVVVALVEAIANPDVLAGTGPINTLLAALTLLVVGVPVWAHFWRRGQRLVHGSDPQAAVGEIRSTPRRLYLFLLLGLATLIAVGALLAGVWILIDELLQGSDGLTTVRSIRYPIGLLTTAAVIAAYHWSVYLHEREQSALPRPAVAPFALLVGIGDTTTAAAVAKGRGGAVWAWTRTDDRRLRDPDEILAAIRAADPTGDQPEVMVFADGDALRVLPIERRAPGRQDANRSP